MSLERTLFEVLDCIGHGCLVLDTAGQISLINTLATRILKEQANSDHPDRALNWSRSSLESLLRRADPHFSMDEDAWVVIHRDAPQHALIMHVFPVAETEFSGPQTLVLFFDVGAVSPTNQEALRRVFDLTPTEARVALSVASGKSLEKSAEAGSVSIGTVRKQLATIFLKTDTHRQGELVALLARLSALPDRCRAVSSSPP
jgi:DNA-binding CsgD family transcriptional regulator